MKKWKRYRESIEDFYFEKLSPYTLPLIIGATTLGLLGYRLLSLVPFGPPEYAVNLGSATINAIKNDILFAPIKTVQIFILKFTENDVYMRLASVAVALSAAVLLYAMLRKWYTTRVSFLTTAMFITSSWFLHSGRLANTDVLYLTTLPALLVACMLVISKRNKEKLPIAAFLVGMALYTPGAWIFIIAGIVALRQVIFKAFSDISSQAKLVGGGVLLTTLLPLIYSFALKPGQIINWLGFNLNQEFTVSAIAGNLLDIPKYLVLAGPDDPARWLVGTPVLDVFTIVMAVLGLYAYHTGYYASRQKIMFGSLIIAVILIGLGNVANLSLLIPLVYLAVANGLAYMLQSWFTVFPRNPVARRTGIFLLVLVIAGSSFYHLHRYFVAWPKAENTHQSLISER